MARTADRVIRYLVDHGRCSDCGGHYNAEDVYVLAEHSACVFDLAAVCRDCYTLSFIRAIVRSPPTATASKARRVNELTPAEVRRFKGLPPVQVDDVLDVCAFLADFDGDFRSLFGREAEDV